MKIWKICLPVFIILAISLFCTGNPDFFNSPQKPNSVQEAKLPDNSQAVGAESPNQQISAASKFILETYPALVSIFTIKDNNSLTVGEEIILIANKAMTQIAAGNTPITCTDSIIKGKIVKGDTMGGILEEITNEKTHHYTGAINKVFPIKSLREGQPYSVITDPESGKIQRFEYEINDSKKLVVEGHENPKARVEAIEYEVQLVTAAGVIGSNLFQSVADIGEKPQLALRLVKLFGSEINFIKNLQEGDRFSVLVEKRFKDGEYKGYGRILAATFTNGNKFYEAYLFHAGGANAQYYNANGENMRKAFLQAPLPVTRVTSRYSQKRFHPILGHARPHLGVDYGAPTGTPVKAVGDGVVTNRGWAGGYGNQIIIKHSGGIESMYSHLSGFARGIKEGAKVNQGQVIGFVGSTGLSTGPHLDFRLRKNGSFIDPAKSINPRAEPVPAKKMAEFKKIMNMERACLGGATTLPDYTVDSLVALNVSSSVEDVAEQPEKAEIKKSSSKRIPRRGRLSSKLRKMYLKLPVRKYRR